MWPSCQNGNIEDDRDPRLVVDGWRLYDFVQVFHFHGVIAVVVPGRRVVPPADSPVARGLLSTSPYPAEIDDDVRLFGVDDEPVKSIVNGGER